MAVRNRVLKAMLEQASAHTTSVSFGNKGSVVIYSAGA